VISRNKKFDEAELEFFADRYAGMDRQLFIRFLRILFGSARLLGLLEHYLNLYDLSQGRFQVMMETFKNMDEGGIPPSELAGLMGVKSASVTGLVDNLERDGLVQRVRNSKDRRKVSIQLTNKATDFLDSFLPFHQQNIHQFLSVFTPEELEVTGEHIERLCDSIEPRVDELEKIETTERMKQLKQLLHKK